MTLLIIALAVAVQVFLTLKKVSPFLSLLIVSVLTGICLGMKLPALIDTIEKGVGNTLAGLALILCLGAVLGKILESGGAARKISMTLVEKFGTGNIQWAVMLTGFLVGIPLFYNAGFVILVPLVFSIAAETGLPLLYIAIPMAAALSVTHCFLPPHPGPVVLVNALKADMGRTLLYGLILAIPSVILAGPFLGRLIRKMKINVHDLLYSTEKRSFEKLPAVFPSFALAFLPVFLITLAVLAKNIFPEGSFSLEIIRFIGDPTIALLLAVLLSAWYFGPHAGYRTETVMKWLNEGISGIAVILLIITAGGVFRQVLTDSGTNNYIASFCQTWHMPPLLFGWLITALLRVVIGSATVAGITASGLAVPLVAGGTVSPELMVLAIGSGSVFGSHVNDTGFWMFKEFFNLSLKQTFFSWTFMETVISILGLAGVLLLNAFIK